MPTVGFEPTIPASERPQTQALDRAATWNGVINDFKFSGYFTYVPSGLTFRNFAFCPQNLFVCVIYIYHTRQRLYPYALTYWCLYRSLDVYIARCELNLQIHFRLILAFQALRRITCFAYIRNDSASKPTRRFHCSLRGCQNYFV
jgi:hypothetical protein